MTDIATALKIVNDNNEEYPEDFAEWLIENFHIWLEFEDETFKLISQGYLHHSARSIVCFLRHCSMVRERNSKYKINNNHSPYLGRLFETLHQTHFGIFERREITTPMNKKCKPSLMELFEDDIT